MTSVGTEGPTVRHFLIVASLLATCFAPVQAVAAEDNLRDRKAAAQDYVGLWFSCLAEWEANNNSILLEVRKDESTYGWGAEWGQPYSASGKAAIDSQGNLVLKGCSSSRGEIFEGCNPDNPPVFRSLPRSIVSNPTEATDKALLAGAWIRTSDPAWQGLAKRCACVARKTALGCVDDNSDWDDGLETVEPELLNR